MTPTVAPGHQEDATGQSARRDLVPATGASAREEELEGQLRMLAASPLVSNLRTADSLERLLRIASDEARAILGASEALTIIVPDGDWQRAIQVASRADAHAPSSLRGATPAGEALYRAVSHSNGPLRLTRAELGTNPRWRGSPIEGSPLPVGGVLAAPLTDADGAPLGVIQVSDKVGGEFTAANEALLVHLAHLTAGAVENFRLHRTALETRRLTDDCIATLSHELRTPLSSILGWARLLRMTRPDRDTTDRALQSIERNVRAQTKLIDDLLDAYRIISGQLRLESGPVELGPVVVAAVEATRAAADGKAVRLETTLDPNAGPIAGDPERLQQIVANLVANAVKFTPAGGRVLVRLERHEAVAEITVRDTGPEIAPELLPHIFEPFRGARRAPGHPEKGIGLGLAVARQLAELQGGAMRAESGGSDGGATFTVTFPLGGDRPPRRPTAS
jgi:signal transduction histidine kinase